MIERLTGNELKKILNEAGFGFSKSLGQNFLADERILNLIADDALITPEQTVLEIGTGAGTLTRVLARRAKKVVSVEIDSSLLPVHQKTLDGFDNVKVINADFLQLDIKKLFKEELEENFAVCANLPYYITTPIIMAFIENKLPFKSITVLVQKEVAQRMAAKANTAEYGSLSCAVQYFARTTLCSRVPPSCFYPAPKVSSQVIRLERLEKPAADVDNEQLFLKLIRAAFAMRRKTLANNLIQAFSLKREQAEGVIEACGIKKDIRGEALDIKQLALITNQLNKIIKEN